VGNAGQENSGKNSVVKSVKVKVNQCVVAAILKSIINTAQNLSYFFHFYIFADCHFDILNNS